MILLKEGLGGHGKQPYDDENGKWVTMSVNVAGVDVDDIDGYVKAILTAHGIYDDYNELDEESKQAYIDEYLREGYEKLLQEKINEENTKNSVYGRVYKTTQELQDALPKMFSEKFFDEYLNTKSYNDTLLYQKVGYRGVPLVNHLLMKMRYGNVKFNPITEEEFQNLSQNAWNGDKTSGYAYGRTLVQQLAMNRNIVLHRGMHYDFDNDKDFFANVFRGYVDTEETGDNMCLSLLGGGCMRNVIYMSTQEQYARGYASYSGHGLLVHAIFESKGANVLHEHDGSLNRACQTVRNAWYAVRQQVRQTIMDKLPDDPTKAQRIYSSIDSGIGQDDYGLIALIMGYDAVSGEAGNGNQLDIVNPRRIKISEQFDR